MNHIDLECLPERQVERVRMLIICRDSYSRALPLLGIDDRDGAVVRLAGIPAMPSPSVCDLSRDGRKILFRSSAEFDSTQTRLCLLDLPTGQPDWLDLSPCVPRDTMAALSPEGSKIAVLSSADERARVDVIDVASRTKVRLWTADEECYSTWESRISWSPGGQLIAATLQWFDHENTYDDEDAVAILSMADGSVQHRYNYHCHVDWLNERELGLIDYSTGGDGVLADVASGASHAFPEVPWEPNQSSRQIVGILDERIISGRGYNDPVSAVFHTDRHGQDVRPLFTISSWPPSVLFAAGTDPLGLGQPDRR